MTGENIFERQTELPPRPILNVAHLIGCNSIDRHTEDKPQHSNRAFTWFHTFSLKLRYSSVSAEGLFFRKSMNSVINAIRRWKNLGSPGKSLVFRCAR